MKLTTEMLREERPCANKWKKFLKDYPNWKGTMLEFMDLKKVSDKDKIWVFSRDWKGLERKQRDFALICADRVTQDCDKPEIQEFFILNAFINVSEMFELRESKEYGASYWASHWLSHWLSHKASDRASHKASDRASYKVSDWAADWAADSDQERKTQVEIIKWLLSGGEI